MACCRLLSWKNEKVRVQVQRPVGEGRRIRVKGGRQIPMKTVNFPVCWIVFGILTGQRTGRKGWREQQFQPLFLGGMMGRKTDEGYL